MRALTIWIFQTGEPLHIDGGNVRPMRAMNLSNALVQQGHKVLLWSSAFYHQEKRHRSISARNIKVSDNLEIRLIPSRGYQRHIGVGRLIDHAHMAFNLKKMLQQAGTLPDVAFLGYPPIETGAVMTRWLARQDVPTLLDVKDQWPSLFLDVMPIPLRILGHMALWPYFHLARKAMRDATALSSMAEGFLEWGLKFAGRKRTDMDGVFPLSSPRGQVTEAQLEESRRWWDEQGIVDDGKPRMFFVGSHSPAFDFRPVRDAAMMAAEGATPCDFVICGDGEGSPVLHTMMAGLPNVHLPGRVDRPKMETLAERSHAALAPYKIKKDFCMSIPNKIIDALSLGLPILCPLHGEVAALISDHEIGMRYGTDSGNTLYECIRTLSQDAVLRKKMSLNARALYAERFSYGEVYGGLVKHLEKLAYTHM